MIDSMAVLWINYGIQENAKDRYSPGRISAVPRPSACRGRSQLYIWHQRSKRVGTRSVAHLGLGYKGEATVN